MADVLGFESKIERESGIPAESRWALFVWWLKDRTPAHVEERERSQSDFLDLAHNGGISVEEYEKYKDLI